ncbi:MAG: nuclear transport factor 2 family protein [Thermomicrobiales bacterium]
MTDVTPVIDRYVAIWNETDAARRRALIAQTWTEDASYIDPLMRGDGPDGIDAMIAGVQQQFPGHWIQRTGEIDAHNDRVRFAWALVGASGESPVVAGVDFGVVAADGRLQAITGFLDQGPVLSEGA